MTIAVNKLPDVPTIQNNEITTDTATFVINVGCTKKAKLILSL